MTKLFSESTASFETSNKGEFRYNVYHRNCIFAAVNVLNEQSVCLNVCVSKGFKNLKRGKIKVTKEHLEKIKYNVFFWTSLIFY